MQAVLRGRFAHGDEPLVGQHGFDGRSGPVAPGDHQLVRLDALQRPHGVEIGDHFLAGPEAAPPEVRSRTIVVSPGLEGHPPDYSQAVALAPRLVVASWCGGTFYPCEP